MKDFARVFGFIFFLLLILYLIAMIREGARPTTVADIQARTTPRAPGTPTPIPVFTAPPPTPDTGYRAAQQQAQQQRTAMSAASQNFSGIRRRLEQVASETRTTIEAYSDVGRSVTVTVAGATHIDPGNFIDGVVRRGWIRDFTLVGSGGGASPDGRRVFQSTFRFEYIGPL